MKEANKNLIGNPKTIRCIKIKDNTTYRVKGFMAASKLTGVNSSTIKHIINFDDKSNKGWKFYDWG